MNWARFLTLFWCLDYYFIFKQNVGAEKESLSYINQIRTHVSAANNCSLSLVPDTNWDFDRVKNGKEMIILSVEMSSETDAFDRLPSGTLYRPSRWIIVLEEPGKRFLLLDEDFIPKSANTLTFSVEYITVKVDQSPEDCLTNISQINIETTIRQFIFSELVGTSNKTDYEFEVCNEHYFDDGTGKGELTHVCCKNTSNGMNCELYLYDKYVTFLNVIVLTVTCVLSTFFPFLIRNSYFRKQVASIYRFGIWNRNVQKVTITKDKGVLCINSLRVNDEFNNFKNVVENFKPCVSYSAQVESVYLRVKGDRIIRDTGESPVNFTKFLWGFLSGRGIKKICKPLQNIHKTGRCLNYVYSAFMKFILFVILTLPITFVLFFYFRNVKGLLEYEQKVTKRRNIESTSNMSCNLVHITIWVSGFVSISMYILTIFVPENDKRCANAMILSCLKGAKKSSLSEHFRLLIRITKAWKDLFVAGRSCYQKILARIFAVLILPAWPILYTIALLCTLHTFFNLTCRLLYAFFFAKQTCRYQVKKQTGQNTQLTFLCNMYGLWWTVSLIAYAWVFCFFCVPFYLKCMVYTLLGFLLNFDDVLKYFTVLSLTIFVVYDGTHHVTSWYRKYFKFVCENIYERLAEEMKNIAKEICCLDNKGKTANPGILKHEIIMVSPENNGDTVLDLRQNKDGYIKLRTPGALLFIDISYKKCYTSISNSLFEKMVKLPHALCPGEMHVAYLKKLTHFVITTVTVLNLVFVVFFLVDQSTNYVEGVQTLAAIGSGLLVFALRRFIFMERSENFDEGNKQMLTHLSHQRFLDCPEDWTVVDIDITDITEE